MSASARAPGARPAEASHIGGQGADVVIVQRCAEGRHPRPPERSTAVLDDVEEVLIAVCPHSRGIGKVPGADEEERGTPGALAIDPMAGGAEAQVQALGAR